MNHLRDQFPALKQGVRGFPLVYLDSAATTLKPLRVADRVGDFLKYESSNVHRGAHYLSDRATEMYETTRALAAQLVHAESSEEIVFTSGTTDGLNILASGLGQEFLKAGDIVLLSQMEHHANIVPWQMLQKRLGIHVNYIPVTDTGELDMAEFDKLLNERVRVLSVVHCSNTLGTLNPVQEMVAKAKSLGIITILDVAQSVSCVPVSVKDLGCDFLVFSAHKLFGPYGVGVLYGRKDFLDKLPPFRGGGSMIEKVSFADSTYLSSPHRFEAGTPNIDGVAGFGEALRFFQELSMDDIARHEDRILELALEGLGEVSGVQILGSPKVRKNIISFTADWGHPSDLGPLLDQQGIAIRTGHHCTQPLLNCFGLPATARASFSIYSNEEDVSRFVAGLKKAKELLT